MLVLMLTLRVVMVPMYIYMPLGICMSNTLCVFWNCCAGVNVSIRGRNWYSNMLRLSGGRGRALHKLSAKQLRKKRVILFYVLDLRKKLKSRFCIS